MARGARSNKGKALRKLRREKVEESTAFKQAEDKRFALIQKLLEDAKSSKAEEAAQRAQTKPAAMEVAAEEGGGVEGAGPAGPSGRDETAADMMDVEDVSKGRKRKHALGVKLRKPGLKVKKSVGPLNLLLHGRHKKGKKPKRQWFVE